MNENYTTVVLIDLMDGKNNGWGNQQGKAIANALIDFVESHPASIIFEISLKDLEKSDASFARESVVAVAKRYRGDKGFFLSNISSNDLLDNFRAGVERLDQPINIIQDNKIVTLSKNEISTSASTVLEIVNSAPNTTTSEVAKKTNQNITNVSTKLNKLREQGFILRKEMTAPTGGKEYNYLRIA